MTAFFPPSRRDNVVVLLLVLGWFSATAWARPLMLPDEGRYVSVAFEMFLSGNWLTPSLNGLPFFHKPPLFYWITAGAMSVFGLNEWAARFASIMGATAGAFSLYLYVLYQVGRRAARFSLLVLLTQPLFFGGAQFANMDILVAGCIGATILLAASAAHGADSGKPFRWQLAAAYFFAAAGVLAKGLIGAVLPALVIVLWLAALRRFRALRSMIWWPGLILFIAVAAPWFFAVQEQFPGFLDYFFVVQHFKRFAQGGFNNVQPFWFYPLILALFTMPWFAWLYRACGSAYWRSTEHRSVRMLMWVWMAVVVVFFSVPQSKLIGYILPALMPLSFLVADSAMSVLDAMDRARKLWWASTATAVILCMTLVAGLTLHPVKSNRELAAVLKARSDALEPVIFIDGYYYDVPFYAGLSKPVYVVADWGSLGHANKDNWSKEFLDAGKFDPPQAAATLLDAVSVRALLCRAHISWIIAPKNAAGHEFLRYAAQMAGNKDHALFRLDSMLPGSAKALQCP